MYNWIHNLPDGTFVLGDSGFGITPKLMTPFDCSQVEFDPYKRGNFNFQLSRARVRIEQVFGIIKRIFPYLAFPRLCTDYRKHILITECLFIMYNILIDLEEIDTSNISRTCHLYTNSNVNELEEQIDILKNQHEQIASLKGYDFLNTSEK